MTISRLNRLRQSSQSARAAKREDVEAPREQAKEPTPADGYQPAKRVGWGRTVGKIKRWTLQGSLLGLAGLGALAAITGPPGLLAVVALGGSGAAVYTANLLGQGNIEQSQSAELSENFHSTLETTTTKAERQGNFSVLEESLARTNNSSQTRGQDVKGTREAQVRTDAESGLTYLWKAKEQGQKLRWNVPRHSENKREIAAYLVDKHLGHYARVPPSVLSSKGEISTFIVDKAKARCDSVPWLLEHPETDGYRRLAIFDNIIGNLDRHSGNFLTTKEGRIVPIDHGLAFPTKNEDQGSSVNYSFDKDTQLTQAESLMLSSFAADREIVTKQLREYLEPEAISAMFDRVETMLEKGQTDSDWRERTTLTGLAKSVVR